MDKARLYKRNFDTVSDRAAPHTYIRVIVLVVVGLGVTLLCGYLWFSRLDLPSDSFPLSESFTIPEGTHVREAAQLLEEAGLVRSSGYARLILVTTYKDGFIHAGTYRFDTPLSTRAVVGAITSGENLSPSFKATFPEGFKTRDLAKYLPTNFTLQNYAAYREYEGYLFPDTYFFSETTTDTELIELMKANFEKKVAPLTERIATSGFTLDEVIILASIVEREANDPTSMRIVAGILKNRLDEDMLLQVDATFEYLLGKTSEELTTDDLEMDSPYNTYRYRGLPPTPIANPGLVAIEAVLDPLPSSYFYYLTGNDGNFYYARTFAEHKENKERYLR